MKFPIKERFELSDDFINSYRPIKPKWGFDGLGEFVFMRTYSRLRPDGKNESWVDAVRRVVEGIYTIQKQHIKDHKLKWNDVKAQKSAQEMFDRIFNFKMLPSGRAFWAMGTDIVMERGLTESLYNCSYLSSKNIADNVGLPFANAMDFLMLGVGVGFDTQGAGTILVMEPRGKAKKFIIPDSREGWVESTMLAINAYFGGENYEFDYSQIRKAGEPIKTFGGISAGSKPLIDLHEGIKKTLEKNIGELITKTTIADIINMVGVAVVSGNVRRSAEIILGDNDDEFLDLKNYEKHPERMGHGWASNNSIYADLGMNYKNIAERIALNGEPGLFWKENAQKYGRMRSDEINWKDKLVEGLNPCAEITLEPSELCNLSETIPNNHENLEDYKRTIKYAYLFAKTITLLNTNWEETNRVMLRNRRIGLSLTGVTQFIANKGLSELKKWMLEGYETAKYYDDIYSDWLVIPKSRKITTAKPSGTLSLLAGATPGIHYPESKYYIRRVRLSVNSKFVDVLKKANYKIEPANEDPINTVVVEFPVNVGDNVKTINDVNIWEQLNLASFVQEHWADNSVSVTVTFKENEKEQIADALDYYQFKLKAVSFLPKLEGGAYAQMPYEEITKEQYEDMSLNLIPLDFGEMFSQESLGEKYCSNDNCEI